MSMAKQPQFRQLARDQVKLSKLNTAYRRKARRVKKLYNVDLNYNVMYLDDFDSRRTFNNYIKQMERATSYSEHRYVKNQHDMVVEREVYQRYKNLIPKINKNRAKEFDELISNMEKNYGVKLDVTTPGLMGDSRFDRYKALHDNFEGWTSPGRFELYLDKLEKQTDHAYFYKTDKQLQENYLTAMTRSLGTNKGQAGEEAYKLIEAMNVYQFRDWYYLNADLDISYVYSEREAWAKANQIVSRINRFNKKVLGKEEA